MAVWVGVGEGWGGGLGVRWWCVYSSDGLREFSVCLYSKASILKTYKEKSMQRKYYTAVTVPVPCSLQQDNVPWLGQNRSQLASVCHSNHLQGFPLHTCYRLPCDAGYGPPRNAVVRTSFWIYGRPY
jgi:hypothetical protein